MTPIFSRIRPTLPIAVLACLIFYFGFQAMTGDRGLLGWEQRKATLQEKTRELARLQAQRAQPRVGVRWIT